MLFSSMIFLLYFLPAVLLLYYAFFFSRTLQNIVLLVSSLFFYAWGEGEFVILMIISIIVNYFFGLLVNYKQENRVLCKLIIAGMVIYNVGILFVFKYFTFAMENISLALGGTFTTIDIALPIGISFFTFQAISYVVDVDRKVCEVQKNPFYLGLYISFFPQLVAGPIVRYASVSQQMTKRKETWKKFSVGVCRFVIGLGKKVLIANNLAIVADHVYGMNAAEGVPMMLAWLGSFAYTLQIFYDFSGYSDMAIGLGLMFGFKFDENFNYPYIARSVTELWRRWHISLGVWFREYVYIPLGGSRMKNQDRVILNMLIVWLLTGIWHGAEWTFLLWGIWNFFFIVAEKLFSVDSAKGHSVFRHIYTLLVFHLGLVLFRAENIQLAGRFFGSLFLIEDGFWSAHAIMFLKEFGIFFIIAIVFCLPIAKRGNRLLVDGVPFGGVIEVAYPLVVMAIFLLSLTYLLKGTYQPFIYFHF